MKKFTLFFSLLLSFNSYAALYDRGNGMIYDSNLNITWLQDSNLAKSTNYTPYGSMTWNQAHIWADSLVYGGFNDWRLPSAKLTGDSSFSYDGSTDQGFGNIRSEMGHLFSELGNIPNCDASGACSQVGSGFLHSVFIDAHTGQTVSFLNIEYGSNYWEAEQFAEGSRYAWAFLFQGDQDYGTGQIKAWAVRDGDVSAVPVPAAAWLFASGLLGLAATSRKRKS